MNEYFVRFIFEKEQAQKDLERGYSFAGYAMYNSPAEVAEEMGIESYEIADYGDNHQYYSARGVTAIAPVDKEGSLWGVMLNGLCGFGPFDTVEEAEEFARKGSSLYNSHVYPFAVIFEGRENDDWRVDDGDCFTPISIVKIIEF
ncbi:MAG: hypothetical protein KatS3mg054_0639 [Chloroflexus sp.]|nr:MAG: hypothetical protein KatS3mg054_0639 [Chloroflexus sp.]